jgi:hypothetical protein
MSEGALSPEKFAQENQEAELKGYVVRLADDSTCLLDLDSEEAVECFEALLPKAVELWSVQVADRYHSKSGPPNTHVVLKLSEPRSAAWRIALQAALGSDPVRELLSLRRLDNGIVEPSRLYRPRT